VCNICLTAKPNTIECAMCNDSTCVSCAKPYISQRASELGKVMCPAMCGHEWGVGFLEKHLTRNHMKTKVLGQYAEYEISEELRRVQGVMMEVILLMYGSEDVNKSY